MRRRARARATWYGPNWWGRSASVGGEPVMRRATMSLGRRVRTDASDVDVKRNCLNLQPPETPLSTRGDLSQSVRQLFDDKAAGWTRGYAPGGALEARARVFA